MRSDWLTKSAQLGHNTHVRRGKWPICVAAFSAILPFSAIWPFGAIFCLLAPFCLIAPFLPTCTVPQDAIGNVQGHQDEPTTGTPLSKALGVQRRHVHRRPELVGGAVEAPLPARPQSQSPAQRDARLVARMRRVQTRAAILKVDKENTQQSFKLERVCQPLR